MAEHARFRVNTPRVVHETIDGEVVIINLESGCYYSLDGVGAVIWNYLDQHGAPAEAASWLSQHYGLPEAQVASAIDKLAAELQGEDLVQPLAAGAAAPNAAAPNGTSPLPAAFQTPVLHKHTDMQHLLLLDPIHEVDENGWPTVKKNPA